MLIVTENTSTRLQFVAQFLSYYFKEEVEILHELKHIPDQTCVLNYSNSPISGCFQIPNEGLLFETGINDMSFSTGAWDGEVTLFATDNQGDIPFDLFSAVFYLTSFYKEYVCNETDQHGRFESKNHPLYPDHHKKPVIDIWLKKLSGILEKRFNCVFQKHPFTFIPTVDVDISYAYLHRGYGQVFKSGLKSIFKSRFGEFVAVLQGKSKDPYDSYDYLKSHFKEYEGVVFFQVGEQGLYDKNIPVNNKVQQALIKDIGEWANVGLHPSYQSFLNGDCLAEEKNALEEVLERPVKCSRQHYLRYKVPETFHQLRELGITSDFSVGFADSIGFRAGTSFPFPFYALQSEEITELYIYPLSLMDATLKQYMNLSIEEAKQEIAQHITQLKKVDGVFIALWHNSSFHAVNDMDGWSEVLDFMMEELNEH